MVSPLVLLLLVAASAAAPAAAQSATDSERRAAFAELLDGARLVGQFTVVNPSTGETMQRDDLYSVSRLLPGDGDVWVFEYSMSYGDNEANTLEIPVRVLFVEDTPLLTMSEQEVPGLGTFSVRLVFHGDRYGGMWSNGPVGGHMWGIIERDEAAAAEKAPPGD
ncbi:MAG: hypothetical protein DWQ36_23590 [Acidobacteria bacterium]|nr:MAG: hypothetical protein DWQ30_21605 [Acidobacteriota bacterium]REK00142.1 MAG: hypothetical protein DWQ36_23590 [Acidobacteriota bacterium]